MVQPKYKYEVIINWREADNSFIAQVPELPGCFADGVTYNEVVTNIQLIMDEWINAAKELGNIIPTPKEKSMFA